MSIKLRYNHASAYESRSFDIAVHECACFGDIIRCMKSMCFYNYASISITIFDGLLIIIIIYSSGFYLDLQTSHYVLSFLPEKQVFDL